MENETPMGYMYNWIISLHENEVALLVVLLGGALTIFAALVGVSAAFRQLRIQFEHKVIYEAWRDFQSRLFDFSSSLNDYWAKVAHLTYVLQSQNNSLVNRGDRTSYRREQSDELTDVYLKMRKAYIDFLVSFETHEVIFLKLVKMNKLFGEEMKVVTEEKYWEFSRSIFPESYGVSNSRSIEELETEIREHSADITNLTIYLQDMRTELQNETVGTILGRKIPKRQPDKGLKVLTRQGWKMQVKQPRKNQ